jgi:hypothetical protein
MKNILIAAQNQQLIHELRTAFAHDAVLIHELRAPFSTLNTSVDVHDSIIVYELIRDTISEFIAFIQNNPHLAPHAYCIGTPIDDACRITLIETGICNLFESANPKRIAQCIRAIHWNENIYTRGTVHALCDATPFSGIVATVISRYCYDLNIVSSIGELISLSERETPALFVVDMDASGFNSQEFAKKATNASSIKKAPLILYKDLRNGLFVHDFFPGIHRLTRVILSREELLNLLITLFFFAEIAGPSRILNTFGFSPDVAAEKTLREIFYDGGPDLCYRGTMFSLEHFETLKSTSDALLDLIARIEPLRWLISPLEKKPTCAGGV